MKQKATNGRFKLFILITFLGFTVWWLYIALFLRNTDHYSNVHNQVFAAAYGVMSLLGGIIGLIASKKWGGRKSALGKALLFFALGLFAQEFGQLAYSFYLYALKVEIPYPSIGEVGYFGSVLLYIYAVIQLAKVVGVKFSLKDRRGKFIAAVLPLLLLTGSYLFFLRDYQFDFSSVKSTLTVILDFGYPLGQALYVAVALLTYILSRKLLGGLMKNKILFVLFALLVQYIADFAFLDAAKAQKVFPAGANDFLYLVSYTVMALALGSFLTLNLTPSNEKTETASTEGAQ